MTSRLPQFESIRALRGIAALSVAVSHLQPFVPASASALAAFPFAAGKAGVDIFFVISGFVMAVATANMPAGRISSLGFLWRRLARIAPLYWIVTIGLIAAIVLDLNLGGQRSVDLDRLIRSLLFIPVHSPDGGIRPVIAVGWTLDYEMYFYLCMTIVVGLFARYRLAAIGALMAGIYLVASATLDPRLDWVLNAGLAVEFLFGFVAARCYHDARRSGLLFALGLLICWIMVPEFERLHPYGAGFDRALSWGMLALLVILVAAFTEYRSPIGAIPLLGHLGDASYALYLIHVPAFALVNRILIGAGLDLGPAAGITVRLLAAVGIALLLHRLIEKPLTVRLQKMSPFSSAARSSNRGQTQ
ncbi:MAG: acyltransferase [Ideonella sp.]